MIVNRSHVLTAVLAGLLAVVTAAPASAQAPFTRPPVVSPYINLNQPGTSPGIQYYGIVRPELHYNVAIPQLQLQTFANQQAVTTLETAPGALTTGHTFGFQTQRRYFQTLGGRQPGVPTRPGIVPGANLATRPTSGRR
jgi:hypothetical protein